MRKNIVAHSRFSKREICRQKHIKIWQKNSPYNINRVQTLSLSFLSPSVGRKIILIRRKTPELVLLVFVMPDGIKVMGKDRLEE
ncbi:hypothetical protein CEXT_226721 [Caerostris extrusa]|uniref:Uncharacterized protein n=1 Tax=Caerostris extrusa TaxID=172846 RepID=A0AAV4M4B9_CAEEX|nr:hypothetical protein CEXT_226721 [Caerostris extrusa]